MSDEGMTLEIYRAEAKKRRLSIPKIKNIHVDMDRWFHVTNPTAMKHMKMLAEAEANEQQEALPPQCPRRK